MDVLLGEYGRPRDLADNLLQVGCRVGHYGLRRDAVYLGNDFAFDRHESPGVDQFQVVLEPILEDQLLDLLNRQSEGEDALAVAALAPLHKRIREGVVGVHEVDVTPVVGDRVVLVQVVGVPGEAAQDLPVLVRDTDDDLDGASQEAQRFRKLELDHFVIGAVFDPVPCVPYVQDEDVERGAGRVVVRLLHEPLDGVLEPFDGFLLNHDLSFFLLLSVIGSPAVRAAARASA